MSALPLWFSGGEMKQAQEEQDLPLKEENINTSYHCHGCNSGQVQT
jgi:hypothetical protein